MQGFILYSRKAFRFSVCGTIILWTGLRRNIIKNHLDEKAMKDNSVRWLSQNPYGQKILKDLNKSLSLLAFYQFQEY